MHVPAPVQEDNHRVPFKERKPCGPYAKTLKALASCNSLITPTMTAASSQAPLPSIPTRCSPPAPQLSSSGPQPVPTPAAQQPPRKTGTHRPYLPQTHDLAQGLGRSAVGRLLVTLSRARPDFKVRSSDVTSSSAHPASTPFVTSSDEHTHFTPN
ncbi:hypothetical protein PtB15_3B174 [Puccinia triticina]|nr:hypothetical protein PtB15_3B174 [Puccinia triticina]